MLNFDFTKSGLEFKEDVISPFRERIEKVIKDLRAGKGEYIFSALLDSTQELERIKRITNLIKREFNTLIVVGIGGSSLGARTLINGLKERNQRGCDIFFLENIDPETIRGVLEKIEPAETAVNFISRSGTTLETVSQYLIIKEYFKKRLKKFYKNFFVITAEENSFLGREAKNSNYNLIKIPAELTGRYSVLSPVGLIPAGAAGLDVRKIVEGAKRIRELCLDTDIKRNPSAQFAIACYHHYIRGKKNIVIMPYRDALFTLGEWFAQLWAESLGKIDSDGVPQGQTPVRGIGTQDQHSLLQLYLDGHDDKITLFITSGVRRDIKIKSGTHEFSYLKDKNLSTVLLSEQKATQEALFAKGRPSITIHAEKLKESSLGGLFYFFEVATLFMASFLKVNPFNQPAVEEIKKRATAILSSNTR